MDPDNQHSNGTPAQNALYVDTNSYLLNGAPNRLRRLGLHLTTTRATVSTTRNSIRTGAGC